LRQNNGILTKEAYSMRKSYLTREQTGELWKMDDIETSPTDAL
jgi:hypothetical protein